MSKYMVLDEINYEYTFHEEYEDAIKMYEETKDYHMQDGCSGEEKVYLFETKKMAWLVEDADRKEDPAKYGFDFWVKWEEKEENK